MVRRCGTPRHLSEFSDHQTGSALHILERPVPRPLTGSILSCGEGQGLDPAIGYMLGHHLHPWLAYLNATIPAGHCGDRCIYRRSE